MGVTIGCQKTGREYDMGYGSFKALRTKVAELCSPEFGKHYGSITDVVYLRSYDEKQKFYKDFDRKTQKLINNHVVNQYVADFCLQSDGGGTLHYNACKEIYNRIKECKDGHTYGYAWHKMTITDFADLLRECVDNKSMLEWY